MSEYVQYLVELLTPFGRVRARKMFGGYGLFYDDLMFGLVADDILYLKVDAESKPLFEARALEPFTYDKGGKQIKMSYHQAPADMMDDSQEAAVWAERAYAAARRTKQK